MKKKIIEIFTALIDLIWTKPKKRFWKPDENTKMIPKNRKESTSNSIQYLINP